jgi:hypothetical protein
MKIRPLSGRSLLLAYFKLRRKVFLRMLAGLVDKGWSRTVREAGKYWRAQAQALHEMAHLAEIEARVEQFR